MEGIILAGATLCASVALGAYLALRPRNRSIDYVVPPFQLREVERQSEKETPVYEVHDAKSFNIPQRISQLQTTYHIFSESATKYAKAPCLGTRAMLANGSRGEYQFVTYEEVAERAKKVASGLRQLGLQPGDTVGIYSRNRLEWSLTEFACSLQSLVVVSLYDTLGENAVQYIIEHSQTKVVVTANESLGPLVNAAKASGVVKHIVHLEDLQGDEKYDGSWSLLSFRELEALGARSPHPDRPPKPDELYTLMYTSGTTGDPKGVMLTHRNVVAMLAGVEPRLQALVSPGKKYLSYLPLAHIFERVVFWAVLFRGGAVGYYQGDVRKLLEDVQVLQPSLFSAVPRVLDRVYDRIRSQVEEGGSLRKWLFETAFAAKLAALRKGNAGPWLYDTLVFAKVRKALGGKVEGIISGSAPLRDEVQLFLRVALGCPVVQGYGLTETCAAGTLGDWEDLASHGGVPLPHILLKLRDVDELNYRTSHQPPQGEILLRGPSISSGYFKDPVKTAEDFVGGWFHTGDIGQINADGSLSIIDRKKNIFKLSQGEYIAAEKLEGVYKRSDYVAQLWVYGDSTKSALIAFVHPNRDRLVVWAKNNGLSSLSFEELCADPKVNAVVLKDLNDQAKAAKLRGFEFIKKVHLTPIEWSVQNDLLTPSFKLKRNCMKTFFLNEIQSLYADIE